MTVRATFAALALSAAAAAPAAAWTTQTGSGTVLVRQQDQGWTLELRCQRSTPNVLGFVLVAPAAQGLAGVTQMTVGAELPGGERRADTFAVTSNGQVAQGNWAVTDDVLEIFKQGLTMGIQPGPNGRLLTTGMTGTAAARNTIESVCGF